MTQLKALGKTTDYPTRYDPTVLETFPNPHPDISYTISIEAPEFTCNCPITGQPDFATFEIQYAPEKLCVESKSFKLYLFSFRNEGAFHEEVTGRIAKDLFKLMQPKWIDVKGKFYPRGGISFHPHVHLRGENYK